MRRRVQKACAILFAAVLTAGIFGVLPARAGASTIVVDETSYTEKINDAIWSNPDSLVTVANKVLVFPASSTSETRLITKSAAKVSEMENVLVQAKADICLEKLPSGEKFILAFGLSSIEGMSGDTGNVEVEFTNNGGVKARVMAYGDDGEKELIPMTSVGTLGSNMKVEVTITKAQEMTLKVGGRVIRKVQIPVSGEGRVGFLQSGNCAAKVKAVDIRSYKYDAPENCDIFEDFESGSINVNLLTSQMKGYPAKYLPSYAKVMDYNGSKAFVCHNSGQTYLGTTHKYSNFEITFDMPYLRTMTEWNSDGEAVTPSTDEFLVGWGYPEMDAASAADYMIAEQAVYFRNGSKVVPIGYEDLTVVPEDFPFFTAGTERGISVKISAVDTKIIVSMKWIDETQWREVLTYQTGTKMPLGYIQFWTLTPGNLAIDNLKIVNKDANPNLIEVEEERFYLNRADDYDYKEATYEYKDLAIKEKESSNWYMLIPATAGICIITLGAVFAATTIKRRKKGEVGNEV